LTKKIDIPVLSVYGSARAGEILAIMGSSGAGKTTLLNVLCNTNQNKIKKMPSCEVLVNGEVLTQQQMRMASAYVQQVDMFVGNLTVFEQLTYSAELRMERSKYSAEDRKERVNHMLESVS
jgi:ATP-binding cassette subfamily G (WHITE) protein 1